MFFPSIAIYYFSNGNWPLAYKLQIGYGILLFFFAIGVLINAFNDSGGRGSNQIGAGGAMFVLSILIILLVLAIGSLAFFYKDMPAGKPGALNPFIKWIFITFIGAGIVIYIPFIISKTYVYGVSHLPDYIKHPIYVKIISQDLSYKEEQQFKNIIFEKMKQSDDPSEILILSRNQTLLHEILFHNELKGNKDQTVIDNKIIVIQSLCSRRKETNYPSDTYRLSIINRLSDSHTDKEIILEYLKCIDDMDTIDMTARFFDDYEFVTLIWTTYPYLRPYYFHVDGKKQIEIISKTIKKKPLTNLETIKDKLNYVNKHYPEKCVHFDLFYDYVNKL